MPIEIKMPALSPTMEEGTLAKWLVKEGDSVKSGDIMAEIETDKATMEFEAVDEGVIGSITVPEGTDGVKVGAVIAILLEDGESVDAAPAKASTPAPEQAREQTSNGAAKPVAAGSGDHGRPVDGGEAPSKPANAQEQASGDRVKASPLARRIAADNGVDLSQVTGSGPNGRIVKADVADAKPVPSVVEGPGTAPAIAAAPEAQAAPAAASKPAAIPDIPHQLTKLSNMRKTIARRLTESKQQVPHIYLTVDVRLDALLSLRAELNHSLESRGVKLSVNDMLVKALAVALILVPKCNVMFTPDQLVSFTRADISVAVSTPAGLITPIVQDAASKSLSAIATEIKELAGLARENKLKPEQFQGGTASISNMGMYGIKQFDAVINPPQAMILAVGAGEKRAFVVDDQLAVATVMSATGSFDHRAIDGADGAELMRAFRQLVERPLGMLA